VNSPSQDGSDEGVPVNRSIAHAQKLLAELKRRKVLRVVAVFGASAFVVMQVADLVFPRIGLPDWTVTLVVALAVLGLPVAAALAWAFEATTDGVRRTEPAASGELEAIVAQPRASRWPAGLAAVAGLVLLGVGTWWTVAPDGRDAAGYDSIAVLPFTNMSGDAANDYFGDGLAEELANALAGIDGLKVAARTSAFAFRGTETDVRRIGDTLRVATVLEGSVRRSADRIRITAQLVDARTGYRIWADTYDRPLTDLFAVQDEIAGRIANSLSARLRGGVAADGLFRGGTTDVEAYDLYLLGRQKWATRRIPLLHEAVAHFEQAIARDSGFALAWSGFADAIDALAWRSDDAGLARTDEALRAAMRSVMLEPELAEGWASLGVLLMEFEHDYLFAEAVLRRALALKPSYGTAQLWLGNVLLYRGRAEEALGHQLANASLDPLSPLGASVTLTFLALGRWDEARDASLRFRDVRFTSMSVPAVRLVTNATRWRFTAVEAAQYAREWAEIVGYAEPAEAEVIGRAVIEPQHRDGARAVLRRMAAAGLPPQDLAHLHLAIGDADEAADLIVLAFERRDPTLIQLAADPAFDPLRGDPRFNRVMESLRLSNSRPAAWMRTSLSELRADGMHVVGQRAVLQRPGLSIISVQPDGRLLAFIEEDRAAPVPPRLIGVTNWHEVLRQRMGR
jgi:adenylate cyclase